MQATVSVFDPETSSGVLLLDDGVRLLFGPEALDGVELLHLRQGQRVHIRLVGTVVSSVSILPR
jgi:2-phospho-L-lactate guanylyltransferase